MSRSSDYDYRVRHRNYTYVPRNFNPREVRRLDLEEDDSPPLDLDCDERLFRSRPDTATNLRLDEIERAVMELDPLENTDVQKDLKLLKHRFKVALDNHDDAARKSRNQDKKLLESLEEAIGVIDERLDTSRFASVQNFEKLKADNHIDSLLVGDEPGFASFCHLSHGAEFSAKSSASGKQSVEEKVHDSGLRRAVRNRLL